MEGAIRFRPSAPKEPGTRSSEAASWQGDPCLNSGSISNGGSCICRSQYELRYAKLILNGL